MQDALLTRQEDFEVWPENWEAVQLFLRVQTQWKIGAFGGFMGLDYSGVEAAFRMMKVPNTEEMFDTIQAMEIAALPVLNKSKD